MGLSFRRRSGRIADGSKLIVPGQITTGVKVFPNSFDYKKGSKNENLGPGKQEITQENLQPTPTPSNTPNPTPPPSPTPTITPTPTPTPNIQLIDPIITEFGEYIIVGSEEYLKY